MSLTISEDMIYFSIGAVLLFIGSFLIFKGPTFFQICFQVFCVGTSGITANYVVQSAAFQSELEKRTNETVQSAMNLVLPLFVMTVTGNMLLDWYTRIFAIFRIATFGLLGYSLNGLLFQHFAIHYTVVMPVLSMPCCSDHQSFVSFLLISSDCICNKCLFLGSRYTDFNFASILTDRIFGVLSRFPLQSCSSFHCNYSNNWATLLFQFKTVNKKFGKNKSLKIYLSFQWCSTFTAGLFLLLASIPFERSNHNFCVVCVAFLTLVCGITRKAFIFTPQEIQKAVKETCKRQQQKKLSEDKDDFDCIQATNDFDSDEQQNALMCNKQKKKKENVEQEERSSTPPETNNSAEKASKRKKAGSLSEGSERNLLNSQKSSKSKNDGEKALKAEERAKDRYEI
ncbi:hypothetical protein RFI_02844 [Reticulomyxa filosa]|uniref:Uncharacterized protein n=1 Tax=Reticulomyxa filosa TaxID=46433 RepID=X6P852_RETFI|nr:hypothetical protein RFI_02844 [Reticulomyxa filosa]|eukprot:ETO34249.1 hypothetical protein RFI_02844 [Reticulomyxa filosa]